MIVPTGQLIRPAGETHAFFGRPTDIALSPTGKLVFVKLTTELMIVDAKTWKVVQELPYPIKERRLDARPGREQGWQAGFRDRIDEVSSRSPMQWPRRLELAAAHRACAAARFT